jgi:glycosyltransferase involved in cell wall biosynthesis
MDVGVVIIGRNEGERLRRCIQSLPTSELSIVYVDSNSSDGSVAYVSAQGFDVVELDMSIPFSAARARNEGYRYLLSKYPDIKFIQFIDGDCEVDVNWIPAAQNFLSAQPKIVAVCGRRRERYPERTIYNTLCDIEWNSPLGQAKSTGGDFMCRSQALVEVGGFNPEVVAGEEPELCFRWRQAGWKIERLDLEMTLHDANMTSIGQWWKRCERSGHAYAQGFFLHGNSPEKYCRKDLARIIIWALLLPFIIVCGSLLVSAWLLVLLLLYPAKIAQLARVHVKNFGLKIGLLYSVALVMGKFPQMKGVSGFLRRYFSGKRFQIIEYKRAE